MLKIIPSGAELGHITQMIGKWGSSQCHSYNQYHCGDTCQTGVVNGTGSTLYMMPCECGGQQYYAYKDVWCCQTGECQIDLNQTIQVTMQFHVAPINCQGKLIPKGQICNSQCKPDLMITHNGKVADFDGLGYKKVCSVNSTSPCVNAYDLCHGESMCPDKRDLKWCLQDNYANSPVYRCDRHIKSQIYAPDDLYDGKYHCLDRSDEDPFEGVNILQCQPKVPFGPISTLEMSDILSGNHF